MPHMGPYVEVLFPAGRPKPVLVANLIAWPFAFFAGRLYFNLFTQRATMTPRPFVVSLVIAAGQAIPSECASVPGGVSEAGERAASGLRV
jgi:hypothetical protein